MSASPVNRGTSRFGQTAFGKSTSKTRIGTESKSSLDEKIRLFDSMLGYIGTYTLDDEKAVHHVDASWNQAWTGIDQVRFYKLGGDRLMISGATAKDPHTGQEIIYRIEFQKVPNTA